MSEIFIIYDSYFGNTQKIAEAMARAIPEGKKFDLRKAGEVSLDDLKDMSTLIVGSPTRQFKASAGIDGFLKRIPKGRLNGVKVAAFDTRMTTEDINQNKFLSFMVKIFGYAAEKIAKKLSNLGGVEANSPQGFYVNGVEGPLLDGELQRAEDWVKQAISG